jgi:hypothetical protein
MPHWDLDTKLKLDPVERNYLVLLLIDNLRESGASPKNDRVTPTGLLAKLDCPWSDTR